MPHLSKVGLKRYPHRFECFGTLIRLSKEPNVIWNFFQNIFKKKFRTISETIFSKNLLIQLKTIKYHQISPHATLVKIGFKHYTRRSQFSGTLFRVSQERNLIWNRFFKKKFRPLSEGVFNKNLLMSTF